MSTNPDSRAGRNFIDVKVGDLWRTDDGLEIAVTAVHDGWYAVVVTRDGEVVNRRWLPAEDIMDDAELIERDGGKVQTEDVE